MNIENLEEVVRPAVKELIQYINVKNSISIANMKFLIAKGLVDQDEYRDFMNAAKDGFISQVKKLGGEDKTIDLVKMAEDEFETHLTNF